VGGALGHASPAAAGTEPAALAGKWHQALERTARAADAGEAPGEHAAGEELPELAFDEAGHACAGGTLGGVQEVLEMFPDDGMQDAGFRSTRLVSCMGPRAERKPTPCRAARPLISPSSGWATSAPTSARYGG
jgi:hypothetical protein